MARSTGVEIRRIIETEMGALLEVYRQCEDFLALGPDSVASPEMIRKDQERSPEGVGFYGIFDSEHGVIGVIDFVSGGFGGSADTAFIELLMIAAPFRSQGTGAEVLRMVEDRIRRDSRVTRIESAVQTNNPNAIRFWHRHGYETVGGPDLQPDTTTTYHLRKHL